MRRSRVEYLNAITSSESRSKRKPSLRQLLMWRWAYAWCWESEYNWVMCLNQVNCHSPFNRNRLYLPPRPSSQLYLNAIRISCDGRQVILQNFLYPRQAARRSWATNFTNVECSLSITDVLSLLGVLAILSPCHFCFIGSEASNPSFYFMHNLFYLGSLVFCGLLPLNNVSVALFHDYIYLLTTLEISSRFIIPEVSLTYQVS